MKANVHVIQSESESNPKEIAHGDEISKPLNKNDRANSKTQGQIAHANKGVTFCYPLDASE